MVSPLTQYIDYLQENNELLTVSTYVDTVLEMTEIIDRQVKLPDGGKALLFTNTGTQFPVLANALGSEKRLMKALRADNYNQLTQRIEEFIQTITLPRKTIKDKIKLLPHLAKIRHIFPKHKSGKGSCQETINVIPNLDHLPILKCWPHDGGKFITLPVVHTIDPDTGIRNAGMYRMQVYDQSTTGMHWHRHKTGARHYRRYKELGIAKMPVVVTLGGDPVYTYCATAPLPDGIDEYWLAGFLRKKAVKTVKAITQPIQIPEDADIVIEGYIDTTEPLRTEGPFGDHTGFYSLEDNYPVFHITCITHKKKAIYPATIVGIPPQEDAYIALATERIFLPPLQLIHKELVNLHLPVAGVAHNIAIVSIKKEYPGQAIKIANALWGMGQMMLNKMMIIVDEMVDIYDYNAVIKAIDKHYQPMKDTHFSSGPADVLDHAVQQFSYGGKLCIDATSKTCEELSGELNTIPFAFYRKGENIYTAKINIVVDVEIPIDNLFIAVWILGNNVDPIRDCKISDNRLIVDACRKVGYPNFDRPWPEIVVSMPSTIETIDKKWESLNIGIFIPSPSLPLLSCIKDITKFKM